MFGGRSLLGNSTLITSHLTILLTNKKNDKRFNNRAYSLFFLMYIFLKHLWFIPNILKWQNFKIFTKLVPSQNPSRISHRRCSLKKIFKKIYKISRETSVLESVLNFIKKTPTQVFASEMYEIFNNTYFEEYLRMAASNKTLS